MKMKFFFCHLSLLLLILRVNGSVAEGSASAKHMVCFLDASSALQEHEEARFFPEDLDLTICTHVVYNRVEISMDLDIDPNNRSVDLQEDGGLGIINRTVALKEQKPELEVFVDVYDSHGELHKNAKANNRSAMIAFTKNALHFVQSHGFDGMSLRISNGHHEEPDTQASENFLPIIREEFQKHGIKLMIFLIPRERRYENVTDMTEPISRYYDLIVVASYWTIPKEETEILSSPRTLERVVNGYRDAGIPLEKLVVAIPAFSIAMKICDRDHRDVHAELCDEGDEGIHMPRTKALLYSSELMRKMANTSEDWIITRDFSSNMLYADSKSLLWASYEDYTSIRQKAAFVLERNMAGIAILNSNMEDFKGLYDKDGMTFPITRTAFNALHEDS